VVAGERHAPADHDDLRIEDGEQVGDSDTEELGRVVHHLEGEFVAVVRRLIDGLGGDPRHVPAHVTGQPCLGARLDRLDGAHRDVGPRGVGLEASVVAALAAASLGVDRGVPDLAGHVGGAVVEPPVEDDPAADAGADGDADGVARAAGRAHPPFPEHRAVGVVVQLGREAEAVSNDLPEREVHPAEVGGQQHDAAPGVERARRTHPHAEDLRARQLSPGPSQGLLRERDEPVQHVAGAGLGLGRLGGERMEGAAVLGHAPHHQIGPADVNAEDESHGAPPLPPP
jgi:hypothetical protein